MKYSSLLVVFTALLFSFSSCSVIEGIFKAGMGVGIFIVILIIALIAFIAMRARKK